jgi:serine/threonine-protein kinase
MSVPEQFGRYQVLSLLGQGAMGLVYKAADPVIERAVAIKVIQANPGLGEADLQRMQARFEQEFRSAGALSHPHIVTIFDVGKEGDHYYIAMEYVDGRGLDAVLAAEGVLSIERVVELAAQLGGALDYAHAQGVVHRDIKPANVLITGDGGAKITDFGLAKLEATTLTRTGALVGTPAYMSPEQIGGHAITGKSDQFSLGIVLYQALTGERPFTGDSPSTIMYKIVHEEPLPPRRLNKSLPAAVDEVFARCLEKDIHRRYGSCAELSGALRQALAGTALETLATATAAGSRRDAPAVAAGGAPTADPAAETSVEPLAAGRDPVGALGSPTSASARQPPPASVAPPSSLSSAAPSSGPVGRWLLGLAIVLPSVALLALVAWLAMQGRGGRDLPDGADGSVAAAPASEGAELTTPGPAGGATGAPGGDGLPAADPGREPQGNEEGQTTAAGARLPAANRGHRAGRGLDRLDTMDGIPELLQSLIASGQVQTGRVRVEAPLPVALRLAPASRDVLPERLLQRVRAASVEDRRRLAAGFLIAASQSHDIELPVGSWRISLLAPRVLFSHVEQVVVRPGQTVVLGGDVPTRFARVRIVAEPPGARVRVDGLLPIPTPYDGQIPLGEHDFEFIWGDATTVTRETIDRDGQEIVGRRRQS